MVTLTSGIQRTRDYEEIGLCLGSLRNNAEIYQHHLNQIAEGIYKRFKDLKSDFDSKMIDDSTYRHFLWIIKPYFVHVKPPYQPALHAEDILAELEKFNISISQENN